MFSYKLPQILSTLLTNYKTLAQKIDIEKSVSCLCGKHMLCDCGKPSGIIKTQVILNLKLVK